GVVPNWKAFYGDECRQRLSLPTYPFERQRYWIDPPSQQPSPLARSRSKPTRCSDITDWGYQLAWRLMALPNHEATRERTAQLIFIDGEETGIGERLARRLLADGERVIRVYADDHFSVHADGTYCICPAEPQDYVALCAALFDSGIWPGRILHCWSMTGQEQ